jgi:tetratricopeptide (TPR) repeat protein
MSKPQASKAGNTSDPANSTSAGGPPAPPNQFTSFEAAMKLFHARQFKEARELFALAIRGPERDVANRAQLHLAMCDRRLQQITVNLGSAEDYYNYGVALINSRNLPEARTHLEKALEMSPAADHVHYALALAQALSGDLVNAQQNLKRAIELEPRNRLIARQDADFAPLANQPPFDALIYPEKKSW